MAWWRISLTCPAEKLEMVETALLGLGAESLSLADAGDEPIFEPLPGDNPIWRESIISALFDDRTDPDSLQIALERALPLELAGEIRRERLDDTDWEQAYRRHFEPLQIATSLWIVPSWCEPPDPDATVIRLDPGLAFGTGGHPTTALCLEWLAAHPPVEQTVIDYGCGSGILAIAACHLGAAAVTAVDIDAQALAASAANLAANGIANAVRLCHPDDLPPTPVDLLIANIVAAPLLALAPKFAQRVRRGGQIVLSGILKSQLDEIQSAYAGAFRLAAPRARDDWICLFGQRRDD